MAIDYARLPTHTGSTTAQWLDYLESIYRSMLMMQAQIATNAKSKQVLHGIDAKVTAATESRDEIYEILEEAETLVKNALADLPSLTIKTSSYSVVAPETVVVIHGLGYYPIVLVDHDDILIYPVVTHITKHRFSVAVPSAGTGTIKYI